MISSKSRLIFIHVSSSLRRSSSEGVERGRRKSSSSCQKPAMTAWQVQNYGDNLTFNFEAEMPTLSGPTDVLVKVEAASANPIDLMIQTGFGRTLLDEMRKLFESKASLPLTLGRDFSGYVEAVGEGVNNFKVGDQVYGTVPLQNQGTLADYVLTRAELMAKRPVHVCPEEAAGILYAGLTAWSSLKITGGILWSGPQNIKVLVIGGSGGVGQSAIQLLKHWGVHVVATCSTDAVEMVKCLGPDLVVNYACPDASDEIKKAGKYDIILDASGVASPNNYAKFLNQGGTFIALRSPLFGNLDKFGLVNGLIQSGKDLFTVNSKTCSSKGTSIRWGYFLPVAQGVSEISELVEAGKLKTNVHEIFPYTEAPKAYDRVKQGHLRGKIVVSKNFECA